MGGGGAGAVGGGGQMPNILVQIQEISTRCVANQKLSGGRFSFTILLRSVAISRVLENWCNYMPTLFKRSPDKIL